MNQAVVRFPWWGEGVALYASSTLTFSHDVLPRHDQGQKSEPQKIDLKVKKDLNLKT